MSQPLVRSGFHVPPIHKPPAIETILGQAVELLRVQALQIEALKRCVGQEAFDAAVAAMSQKPPEPPTP